MLDGTSSGLSGCRTSQETFYPSPSAPSRDIVVKRSGISLCLSERHTSRASSTLRGLGINRTGVTGSVGRPRMTEGLFMYIFGSDIKIYHRIVSDRLTTDHEWSAVAKAANQRRLDGSDAAGKRMSVQPPWQEMHRKLLFFLPHQTVLC